MQRHVSCENIAAGYRSIVYQYFPTGLVNREFIDIQSIRHISSSHIFPGCEGSELICFCLLCFSFFDTFWFKFGSGPVQASLERSTLPDSGQVSSNFDEYL